MQETKINAKDGSKKEKREYKVKENNSKAETKRILIYIITTFALTWIYCLTLIYPLMNGETLSGVPAIATQLLVAAAMFFPAIPESTSALIKALELHLQMFLLPPESISYIRIPNQNFP